MKKVICVLVAAVLVVALFLGCAPAAPSKVVFAASTVGSGFYTMAVGLVDVLEMHTSMEVEVQSIGSDPIWLPLFETGKADIGLTNVDAGKEAYLGLGGYEEASGGKGYNFRTIQIGSPLLVSMLVKNDSDIQSIPDLKGKKVPSGFGGFATAIRSMEAFLANGGLTYDDVISVSMTTMYGPDAKNAFIEGRADCLLLSLGSGLVAELDASVGVRYLSLDPSPEAIAKLQEHFIAYPYPVKAGSSPGVREDIHVRAHDVVLIARTTLSDDVVYEITKAIWENHEELFAVHPRFKQWLPERYASTMATFPYHPGAIKFYKEKGVWTSDLEAHQKKLLALK
ncbi:TAXI family TRAP transporter solute-binding subunit [Chloroflexota bacterium]